MFAPSRSVDVMKFLFSALLQQVMETSYNKSSNTVDIYGRDKSWHGKSDVVEDQLQRRNSTGSTPRLIRHVKSRATSPANIPPSRSSSPSRALHVQSHARRAHSPSCLVSSRSVSPTQSQRVSSRLSAPVGKLSTPVSLRTIRTNAPQRHGSRRQSIPSNSGRAPSKTKALVHNSPRRYKKANVNLSRPRRITAANKTKRQKTQGAFNYGGSLSDGDGAGFLRSIESIPAHSGSRSAYDFANANQSRNVKTPQIDFLDIEIDVNDHKPWIPTGIYAVMLITLWTAVVRLIDAVEGNGPEICGQNEEIRLWICAVSFSLMQGLAEALWQRKDLLKVLFSAFSLFGYFMIAHIQPLSCRVGHDKVTELSKWQCAVNFFVCAFLGIRTYGYILESMRERKRRKEIKQIKRYQGDSDDEFKGLPEGVL